MMIHYQSSFINEQQLPVVWSIVKGQQAGIDSICTWLREQKAEIDKILHSKGALILRGFTHLISAADFERAISAISPHLRDYIGGTSPREKVHGKIMTATNRPPTWSIPLHQEMSYTQNPPSRIAFFCTQPATIDGYSTLGDMQNLTNKIAPAVLNKFKQHGLQLRRTLPAKENVSQKIGLQKSWNEAFETSDPGIVNAIAKENVILV